MLLALSTGHKLGLAGVAAIFILFALASALLIPTWRPQFPGRGLGVFLVATVVLFAGMLLAVVVFGRESEEAAAGEGSTTELTTQAATTAQTSTGATTEATTTQATTTAGGQPQTVKVAESEFKIALPSSSLKPGKVEFDLSNEGTIGHDLVVQGPGVDNAKTPVTDRGKQAKLTVTLQKGTYELYCSVPGHKQAGMDTKLTVS